MIKIVGIFVFALKISFKYVLHGTKGTTDTTGTNISIWSIANMQLVGTRNQLRKFDLLPRTFFNQLD